MKKTLIISSLIIGTALLSGCDKDHDRKEQCTELRAEASKAFNGEATRKKSEIQKDWDDLQCKQSDIIQG
ncbi:hypothetical protein WH357_21375 [Enterobacter ludwigii]